MGTVWPCVGHKKGVRVAWTTDKGKGCQRVIIRRGCQGRSPFLLWSATPSAVCLYATWTIAKRFVRPPFRSVEVRGTEFYGIEQHLRIPGSFANNNNTLGFSSISTVTYFDLHQLIRSPFVRWPPLLFLFEFAQIPFGLCLSLLLSVFICLLPAPIYYI